VQREASVGTIAVHSLEYGATMLVDPVRLDSWLLVSSPVRGRLQVRSGREERNLGVGETVVLDPFRKFSLCFAEDCRLRTIRFDWRLVERVLGEFTEAADTPRAEFGLGGPKTSAAVIESEPDRIFHTADLAATAGLSARALQEAFRRHLGTTPLGYVREVRLRRAHEDLIRAGADSGATVAEVAYRWGFGNLGRFARVYADRYGRHPCETLRR
jgi:AraC-like DNA-binding protein